MLIENKKTNNRVEVTPEGWQTLKDLGFHENWRVISRQDATPQAVTVKEVLDMHDWEPKKTPKKRTPKKKTI